MFRVGIISEVDPEKYLAKVQFDDDGLVSDWLHVIARSAIQTKEEFPIDKDEQVLCMMDDHSERGYILGAVYNDTDTPDGKSSDLYQTKFSDGTIISYDRASHTYTLKINNTEFIATQNGFTLKRSTETLKKILDDLLAQILALTVTTPVGPSGTPINAAQLTEIKQRIPNLFEE